MKRTILMAAAALAVILTADNLSAQGVGSAQAGGPSGNYQSTSDWRCCWHNNCWWYWTVEGRWLQWTGTAWVPYGQQSGYSGTVYVTNYGSDESQNNPIVATPAPAARGFSSGIAEGQGSGFAGYGWTWGPGTAFSSGPGRRF